MNSKNWKERVKDFVWGFFSDSPKSFVEEIINEEEEEEIQPYSNDFESEEKLNMNDYHDIGTSDSQSTVTSETSFTAELSEAVAEAIKATSKNGTDNGLNLMNSNIHDITIEESKRVSTISPEFSTSDLESFFMDLSILIDELDAVLVKESIPNVVEIIKYSQDRIIETMIKNGGVVINTENGFDIAKHRTIPFKIEEQGRKINRVVRPGVAYNGTTIVKALVET